MTTVRYSAPSKAARRFAPTAAQALAGLCIAACALSAAGCKSQDAAINLTIRGQFLPSSVDTLVLDVLDNKVTILQQTYPFAPPKNSLPTSVVIVQAGASHPTVKINVLLGKDNRVVGRGSIDADFVDGKTVDIAIDVLPQ
jgi:hypothetical protein